jgi:general secretion pathway protein E
MSDRWYSIYQVADLIGTSHTTVARWAQDGLLEVERSPDGSISIPERSLLAFLERQGIDLKGEIAKSILRHEIDARRQGAGPQQPRLPSRGEAQAETGPEGSDAAQPAAATHGGETTGAREGVYVPAGPAPRADASVESRAEAAESRAGAAESRAEAAESRAGATESRAGATESRGPDTTPADPVAQVADAVVADALESGAESVHLLETPDGLSLRLRIDGVFHSKPKFATNLPANVAGGLVDHILAVAGAAKDGCGSFARRLDGREADIAVTCLPTADGRAVFLRLAQPPQSDKATAKASPADDALLPRQTRETFRALLGSPFGMIVTTGRTADARDLAAAILAEADLSVRSACWVGEGCPIDGMASYKAGAGAVARAVAEGFDIIAVARLDDLASASAAATAARDGRCVIASLPAPSVARAVSMLLAAADGWSLASSLLAVAQTHPLRRLCGECASQAEPSAELVERLALDRRDLPPLLPVARGCPCCGNTGYAGTTRAAAVVQLDGSPARLMCGGDCEQIVRTCAARARNAAVVAALQAASDGLTTLDEAARSLRV